MMRRTPKSAKSSPRERVTPERVPLWREVIAVETDLRPTVPARDPARRDSIPYVRIAASVVVVSGFSIVGAMYIYREQLVRSRESRAPQLQGPPIASVRQLLRPRIIEASWLFSGGAFGCALITWLLVFALTRTRRFAMRWALVPGIIGAAAWLAAQWWLLFVQ